MQIFRRKIVIMYLECGATKTILLEMYNIHLFAKKSNLQFLCKIDHCITRTDSHQFFESEIFNKLKSLNIDKKFLLKYSMNNSKNLCFTISSKKKYRIVFINIS